MQKMTTMKRVASNNSLRNKKERAERPGAYKKKRKCKIKRYMLPSLSTPQIHTLSLLHCGGADSAKPVTAFSGRRVKTVSSERRGDKHVGHGSQKTNRTGGRRLRMQQAANRGQNHQPYPKTQAQ